ncbi:MAG: LysR substrate-binding domain-containing protein [Lysobacterales bacterium]|jgi:DNA-binding transcriptional LysR family regulator
MRLRHIEVFHAVYTTGSITAAARLLSVSQPAVSKVLAHAEQQLGFALFYRHKGKLVPTQEAEQLIYHVTGAYENISELRRVSENLRTADAGWVRIATIPALEMELLPRAVASYLKQHPDTHLEIDSLQLRQIISELREHRINIGLAFNPPVTPGIQADVLATGEMVALVHARSDPGCRKDLSLEELEGFPLISLSTKNPLGNLLANHFEACETIFQPSVTVETYQLAAALVVQGVGIAIVDEFTARSFAHPELVICSLRPALRFDVAMLRLENEPLSLISERFVKYLQAEIDSLMRTDITA